MLDAGRSISGLELLALWVTISLVALQMNLFQSYVSSISIVEVPGNLRGKGIVHDSFVGWGSSSIPPLLVSYRIEIGEEL